MLVNLLQWLSDQRISTSIRESFTIFPALECIHIYSMIFLIGIVGAFDLRLLGFQFGRHPLPLAPFSKLVIRCACVCFAVNFITGSFLFSSKAPDYYVNIAFRIKMLLILAGVAYHSVLLSRASRWGDSQVMSIGTKLAGGVSMLLWVGVIAASRWIAYEASR